MPVHFGSNFNVVLSEFRSVIGNWRLRTWLLSFLLIAAIFYLQYSHILFCEAIGFSSFKPISQKVYVSPSIPGRDHAAILQMIKNGEKRISDFWGAKQGKATIIVCGKAEEYERFCNTDDGAGCSLGTFYGSSFVVLNFHGINTDVISHEICHDELFQRLGWYKTTFQIPQWFNEGLSMMLDYRFVNDSGELRRYHRYLREWKLRTRPPAKRIALEEIESLKGFFDGDDRHVTLAYLTAATEVSYWLLIVGKSGLLEWTQKMKSENFNAYHKIESHHLNKNTGSLPPNPIRRLSLQRPVD